MSEKKQVCKKCGRELDLTRGLKRYEDKYRVWCVCGRENFYYLEKKEEVKKENDHNQNGK